MDGRRFIETVFASQEAQPITQVVMNLPQDAAEFLGMRRRIRLLVFFQLFHLLQPYVGSSLCVCYFLFSPWEYHSLSSTTII